MSIKNYPYTTKGVEIKGFVKLEKKAQKAIAKACSEHMEVSDAAAIAVFVIDADGNPHNARFGEEESVSVLGACRNWNRNANGKASKTSRPKVNGMF